MSTEEKTLPEDALLPEDMMETVLISAVRELTGHERIVVAFRDGSDLYIPLDTDRPANHELLNAAQLYVREVHNQYECSVYDVKEMHPIGTGNRQRLEAYAHRAISETTEILHVVGGHAAVIELNNPSPGFVAVIDGSERALRALAPAMQLAEWYGRVVSVCAVTADGDDVETSSAIQLQLDGTALDPAAVTYVPKRDLEAFLFEQMRQGQILVGSAFGVWSADGRLHGMLNGLVRHNAPAIIGIGPNVPEDWRPASTRPLVVCVDNSEHAHDIVERIDPFITPPRERLKVVHVTTEVPADTSIADEVATELHRRCGLPVGAEHIQGSSAAESIAAFAEETDAQMVIMTSWHRSTPGSPRVGSTAVASVEHSPCPVAILRPIQN